VPEVSSAREHCSHVFLTYQDIRPWARSIKEKAVKRDMRHGSMDRTVGTRRFKDDPSLTDQEIATIAGFSSAEAGTRAAAPFPPFSASGILPSLRSGQGFS
jgi:hypothetical protein